MRKIFIGDVHGCFEELQLLLEKLEYTADDQIYFVGDVINKGPQSANCLKWVRESGSKMVLGNHEAKFLEFLEGKFSSPKFQKISEQLDKEDLKFLKSLPLYIEEEDFLLVHAGLKPKTHPQNTPRHVLLNIRTWDGLGKNLWQEQDPAWHDLYTDPKLVIYGHWATQGLKVKTNCIGLDSGCCYGKKLSALVLPDREILQVDALSQYVSF